MMRINDSHVSKLKHLAGDESATRSAQRTTVQQGEKSLAQVAQRLKVGEKVLHQANPQVTDPTALKAGQELRLPEIPPTKLPSEAAAAETAGPTTSARGETTLKGNLVKTALLHSPQLRPELHDPSDIGRMGPSLKENIPLDIDQGPVFQRPPLPRPPNPPPPPPDDGRLSMAGRLPHAGDPAMTPPEEEGPEAYPTPERGGPGPGRPPRPEEGSVRLAAAFGRFNVAASGEIPEEDTPASPSVDDETGGPDGLPTRPRTQYGIGHQEVRVNTPFPTGPGDPAASSPVDPMPPGPSEPDPPKPDHQVAAGMMSQNASRLADLAQSDQIRARLNTLRGEEVSAQRVPPRPPPPPPDD